MYKNRKITEEDWKLFDSIFQNYYVESAVIDFKKADWKRVLVENRYLLEEQNIVPFFNLLRYTNSPGIIVMPIMFERDYRKKNFSKYLCVEFSGIPDTKEFLFMADEHFYTWTGGIIISLCNKIAAFADVDNSILYLGYEKTIEKEVMKNFSSIIASPSNDEA